MSKKIKPIKSKKEANSVLEYLTNETVRVTKCSKEQAEKRIKSLLNSGELNGLTPDNPLFKLRVDRYMATPVE